MNKNKIKLNAYIVIGLYPYIKKEYEILKNKGINI